jgi:uncharacterized lipoprotein
MLAPRPDLRFGGFVGGLRGMLGLLAGCRDKHDATEANHRDRRRQQESQSHIALPSPSGMSLQEIEHQ